MNQEIIASIADILKGKTIKEAKTILWEALRYIEKQTVITSRQVSPEAH